MNACVVYFVVFALLLTPVRSQYPCTAILIIIEGQFQVLQRFSSSNLVLKAVESCFMALRLGLNYY
jgi:hypothetical protein